MPAIVRTPADRMTRGAARVVRAEVASGGRLRQSVDRAPVPPGELVGLRVLTATLLLTQRTEIGDRVAAAGVGHTAAGVARRGAKHTRKSAGKRPRHGRTLAEP